MHKLWWAALGVAVAAAAPGCAAATVTFDFTGVVESWTAPERGYYEIDAWGARGGGYFAGFGAHVGGEVLLEAGAIYSIVVGGRGAFLGDEGAGGGGGTWMFSPGAVDPLLVAGGGGGDSYGPYSGDGQAAVITQGDGRGGSAAEAGGGAGWLAAGKSGGPVGFMGPLPIGTGGQSGSSFAGGQTFGCPYFSDDLCVHRTTGGFGGGGGAAWTSGGGGGGYTGGDTNAAENGGGGGSSFVSSTFLTSTKEADARDGDGLLTIDFLTPAGVPEPASWALMILGFGAAGVALRRKRLVAA